MVRHCGTQDLPGHWPGSSWLGHHLAGTHEVYVIRFMHKPWAQSLISSQHSACLINSFAESSDEGRGKFAQTETPEGNKVEGRTHCYPDSGLCPPSLHRSTRPLEHPASCHSGKSEPRWAGQQEPTGQEKGDDALPVLQEGPTLILPGSSRSAQLPAVCFLKVS